jgi:hypothetical protein
MTRLVVLLCWALSAWAQQYNGPRPPKPDIPYFKHASNLIPTESAEAKEQKNKDDTLYTIQGAASTAKTPLAMPIFILKADKLSPSQLQLFRLESKDSHREILFAAKNPPTAFHMEVTRLSADGIYKIEVDRELDPGEYTLSPAGSNQVFCFQVF